MDHVTSEANNAIDENSPHVQHFCCPPDPLMTKDDRRLVSGSGYMMS